MSGAGFIFAINLVVAGLFGLAFLLVGFNARSTRVPFWFAAAYGFVMLYLCCELIQPSQVYPKPVYLGGFACFFLTLATANVGIARHFQRAVPWKTMAALFTLSLVANWVGYDAGRDSALRQYAYQVPYAGLQAMGAWLIWRSGRRHPLDIGILLTLCFSTLQFLSKPMVAGLTGGPGDSPQTYIATTYALYSQSLGAVLQVAIGLLMLTLLVRGMLVEITERSETDPLSGLYNRRGFENRVEPAFAAVRKAGMPAAMVISDLDHFKAVNDSYGHDTGDRVIEAFAAILKRVAAEPMTVARMGGEEFTVFLPGTNAAGARLFAEAVRAAMAATPIQGLPEWKRCTASFGVAEWQPGESVTDLRRRADGALYAAKQQGRDRVCLAATGLDAMPDHPYRRVGS
jgi:diguanylate cyclase (GGDEF)-like protein